MTGPPTGGGDGDAQRKWLIPALVIGAVVVILAFVLTQNDSDDATKAAQGGGELFLQPIAETGPDPFGPSVAGPSPTSTIPPDTPITFPNGGTAPTFSRDGGSGSGTGGAITVTARSGGTPGLYGGTRNQSSCNKQAMIDFLQANPAKQRAWADVQGISASEVSGYIDDLTPVILRSDTRVTNHGFKNGRPNPMQSVLQAGTAVLVDKYGVPRARCACGNPLLPPIALSGPPDYKGSPPWDGFSPGNVTVINNSTTIINVITIIDINTGTPFGRGPTGPDITLPPGGFTTTTGGTTNTTSRTSTTRALTGTWTLVNVEPKNQNPQQITVDGNAGKARFDIGNGNTADYYWTVPQTIGSNGVALTYGGRSQGNVATDIVPYPVDGNPTFSEPNPDNRLAHGNVNSSAEKSVTLYPPANVTRFSFKFGMGYALDVIYTYELRS
ncbi:MAG: hypothetical protein Q8K63_04380 [Acidimicrobiales bacterium]|nr:hypothetical protein [Acidimicrobiales bacterium]